MRIIAISGKAESGKDTIANFISKNYGGKIVHFADEVKHIATVTFGWDGKKDEKGRNLLQLIGDGARQYNKDIWVDKLLNKIENSYYKHYDYLVIPDLRYENEFDALREFAGNMGYDITFVRVERPNHSNRLTEEQRNNASETSLDQCVLWDKYVVNDKGLAELECKVGVMLNELL